MSNLKYGNNSTGISNLCNINNFYIIKILLVIGVCFSFASCESVNESKKALEVSCLIPDKITDDNVVGIVVTIKKNKEDNNGVIVLSKANTYEMRMDVEISGGLIIEKTKYEWVQVDSVHNETFLVKGIYKDSLNTIKNDNFDNNHEFKSIKGGILIKVRSFDDENEKGEVYCETNIYPKGFPLILSIATNYTGNDIPLQFNLPQNIMADSFHINTNIYTSLYTLLQNSCDSLMRQPIVSFEHIADIIYSKVLLLKYMKSHKISDEKVMNENINSLEYYYNELLKYQNNDGGFEWFGKNLSNEGLTAYGIMVLNELKTVIKVDNNIIEKARNWLLSRQLNNGYFNITNNNNNDILGVVGNSSTTAFIYWALSEERKINITKKFLMYYNSLSDVRNSYIIGLLGLIYDNIESKEEENADNMGLLLTKLFNEDGSVMGRLETIVGSAGENSVIEATCVCILLYMRLNQFDNFIPFVDKSINYLYMKNNNGIIGSSHSTILALKVLIEYENYKRIKQIYDENDNPKIETYYNNEMIGVELLSNLSSHSLLTLTIPYTQYVKENENELVYKSSSVVKNIYKFSLSIHYNSVASYNDENCRVRMLYELRNSQIYQDEVVDLVIRVENKYDQKIGMVVAMVGIPGGLVIDDSELNNLIELNVISSYSNKENELIFYWRGMTAGDVKTFLIHTKGIIPGNYKGKVSYIYEYYNNNLKWWLDGLNILIMQNLHLN